MLEDIKLLWVQIDKKKWMLHYQTKINGVWSELIEPIKREFNGCDAKEVTKNS